MAAAGSTTCATSVTVLTNWGVGLGVGTNGVTIAVGSGVAVAGAGLARWSPHAATASATATRDDGRGRRSARSAAPDRVRADVMFRHRGGRLYGPDGPTG